VHLVIPTAVSAAWPQSVWVGECSRLIDTAVVGRPW